MIKKLLKKFWHRDILPPPGNSVDFIEVYPLPHKIFDSIWKFFKKYHVIILTVASMIFVGFITVAAMLYIDYKNNHTKTEHNIESPQQQNERVHETIPI